VAHLVDGGLPILQGRHANRRSALCHTLNNSFYGAQTGEGMQNEGTALCIWSFEIFLGIKINFP
jgi:hypothetical protein